MVRLMAVFVLLAAAVSARADDVTWPSDPDTRITAQIAACKQGNAAVCLEAASTLGRRGIGSRLGDTPASLRALATRLLDEQCTAGGADSCYEQGRLLAKRGDVVTGTKKLERGCELGSGAACAYLAGRAKNARRSMELVERACTLDDAHACESLAEKIAKKDPVRANELHRKACAGSDANGCIASGLQQRASGAKAGAFRDLARALNAPVALPGLTQVSAA